jgi:hypothetical protein
VSEAPPGVLSRRSESLIAAGIGAGVPAQVPPTQASSCVHDWPSSHAVPSGAATLEQPPLSGLQTPTWQASGAVQVTGFDPVHTPDWHVSVCVHAFESLHALPSGRVGLEQVPVAVSHVPAS